MSLTAWHTWETNTGVVSEQTMQYLFMWNVTREVLYVQGVGAACSKLAIWN